jgi:hypothetical protein
MRKYANPLIDRNKLINPAKGENDAIAIREN